MKKGAKSVVQLIVETMMTGRALKSKELADLVAQSAEREIKVQDVASMLSKISSPQKCPLGLFIKRTRQDGAYIYELAPELLSMPPEKVYGLALKTGPSKYSIEEALAEYPELSAYMPEHPISFAAKPKGRPRKQKKAGEQGGKTKVVSISSRKKAERAEEMEPEEDFDTEDMRAMADLLEGLLSLLQDIHIHVDVDVTVRFDGSN